MREPAAARRPLVARLATVVAPERVRSDAPVADLTTFRVGGSADVLVDVRSVDELVRVVGTAAEMGAPLTVLGGGSNVLVGDRGIRGVVLRVQLRTIDQSADNVVRAESGVTINGLVRWTVGRGLAGLEAWAGTPGTVGGAIAGNAHFRGRDIGTLVERVRVVTRTGAIEAIAAEAMAFGYDTSRLKGSGEILISADFRVSRGDSRALRRTARASLAYRKQTQPLALPSAGCVFQNPDPARDAVPADVPPSAGALVDRAGAKGLQIGGARVSESHANFVVSDGTATAADIRAVIEAARTAVRDRFGVELRDEVVFLGEF